MIFDSDRQKDFEASLEYDFCPICDSEKSETQKLCDNCIKVKDIFGEHI
jgi:hypothetical protein